MIITMSSTINIQCEFDLHAKVVEFIRKRYPSAIIIPGLGELQITDQCRIRSWQKGYTARQPDLILINTTGEDVGLAIELKTPKGAHADATYPQKIYLAKLRKAGFKTVVSNSYDEILFAVITYMESNGCGTGQSTTHP